jgi:hypothetical protein
VLESKEDMKISIDEVEYNLSDVIEAYNTIEGVKKINKKTGVKKVGEALENLEESVLEALIEKLTA